MKATYLPKENKTVIEGEGAIALFAVVDHSKMELKLFWGTYTKDWEELLEWLKPDDHRYGNAAYTDGGIVMGVNISIYTFNFNS